MTILNLIFNRNHEKEERKELLMQAHLSVPYCIRGEILEEFRTILRELEDIHYETKEIHESRQITLFKLGSLIHKVLNHIDKLNIYHARVCLNELKAR